MIGVNADIKGFIMFGNHPRTPLPNVINVSARNLEFLISGYHNKV
jgi:hypothetical protein